MSIPTYRFAEVAEGLLHTMLALKIVDPTLNRTGGYLVVVNEALDTMILTVVVGNKSPPEQLQQDLFRVEVMAKTGRGVRAGDFRLAFSGLPDLAEEALVLGIAIKLKLMTLERAHQIADLSDNEVFRACRQGTARGQEHRRLVESRTLPTPAVDLRICCGVPCFNSQHFTKTVRSDVKRKVHFLICPNEKIVQKTEASPRLNLNLSLKYLLKLLTGNIRTNASGSNVGLLAVCSNENPS